MSRLIAGQFDDLGSHHFSNGVYFRSTDLRSNAGVGYHLVLSSLFFRELVSSAGGPGAGGVIFLIPSPIWPSAREVGEKP